MNRDGKLGIGRGNGSSLPVTTTSVVENYLEFFGQNHVFKRNKNLVTKDRMRNFCHQNSVHVLVPPTDGKSNNSPDNSKKILQK